MTNTGFSGFDSMIQQANEILAEIENVYGWQNRRNQSYAIVMHVLHALRDRLPLEQVVHLGAQLPTLFRGIYYQDWKPSETPIKMSKQEFIDRIRTNFLFSLETDIQDVIKTTLTAILKHVSEGEVAKIKDTLPEEYNELISVSVSRKMPM